MPTTTPQQTAARVLSRGPVAPRFVAGYDGSDDGLAAVRHAVHRAGDPTRVLVVHAVRECSVPRSVEAVLEGLEVLTGCPVEVRTGVPEAVLADVARRRGAEAVVVGSRGLGRCAGALGSVSRALVVAADRPVVAVPHGGGAEPVPPLRNVVVGFDGSATSAVALRLVVERAPDDARIVVVCAFDGSPSHLGGRAPDRDTAARQPGARAVVRRAVELAGDDRVEGLLVDGPPADALLRSADAHGAAEICIGSRGLGTLRGALGSVSQEVVRRARLPVCVVPHRLLPPRGA